MDRYVVIEFEEYPDEWTRMRLDPTVAQYAAVIDAYNEAARRMMPEAIATLCDALAPFLDSWTYPEPADRDGLAARDVTLVFGFARSWVAGVREVPLPLPRKSSDGEPSEDQTTSP